MTGKGRVRRYVDDAAAPSCSHEGCHGADAQECSGKVDVQQSALRIWLRVRDEGAVDDAGIVDQNVGSAGPIMQRTRG